MAMTSPPSIPLEIQHLFIEALGEDGDHESLKACSLVSWAFVTISRRALFASGNLTLNDQREDGISMTRFAFERLIVRNPEITTLIRSLHYCPGALDHESTAFLSSLTSMRCLKAVAIFRDQILKTPNTTYIRFHWNNNPLRHVLLRVLALPCLESFRINYVDNFFLFDLAACDSLRYLMIENCVLDEHTVIVPSFPNDSPLHAVRLRGLMCRNSSSNLMHDIVTLRLPEGTFAVDLGSLTRLDLTVNTFSVYQSAQALLAHCTRLEAVQLLVSDFGMFDPSVATLLRPAMTYLRQINLDLSVNEANPDPLFDLPSLLQDMRVSNVLEAICINLSIETTMADETGFTWSLLDQALSGDVWNLLQEVTIDIEIIEYDGNHDSGMLKDTLECLPETRLIRLATNESIDFNFHVDFED